MNRRGLVFFLFLTVGVGVLNYPFISQWVNRQNQSKVVQTYNVQTQAMESKTKQQILREAQAYNTRLVQNQQQLTDGFTGEPVADTAYNALLNPGGDGIMGTIEIPAIEVALPIYHGTGAQALQNGVGHLVQSSLPVGGTDTHAVLSAHTGLASKALFTDLDRLQLGDSFALYVLGETLTYQVCDITTVRPYETELLAIQPGRDLVTLVTCKPYGINSHRLLVTGERVDPAQESLPQGKPQIVKDGRWRREKILFGGSMMLLLGGGLLLLKPENKGGKRSHG